MKFSSKAALVPLLPTKLQNLGCVKGEFSSWFLWLSYKPPFWLQELATKNLDKADVPPTSKLLFSCAVFNFAVLNSLEKLQIKTHGHLLNFWLFLQDFDLQFFWIEWQVENQENFICNNLLTYLILKRWFSMSGFSHFHFPNLPGAFSESSLYS